MGYEGGDKDRQMKRVWVGMAGVGRARVGQEGIRR